MLSAKKLGFTIIILLLFLVVTQVPRSQALSSTSEEKALSFLNEVIGLDISKYTASVTRHDGPNAGEEYITYRLDSFLTSQVNANFFFYQGKLDSCNLNPSFGSQILYSKPKADPFNTTLNMVERYQSWLNDSQVQEMVNLLRQVGSVRNATEFSGNLTFKIVVYSPSYTVYKFSNTFNGVDYTGLSLTFSGNYLYFNDDRGYRTIGDTTIYVSREEAISIAEDFVRNYSYTRAFSNGTKETISNLNVTGVGTVSLGTRVFNPNDNITAFENAPLSPYWYIQVNVNNIANLAGIAVSVSATDGTVASSIFVGKPFDFSIEPRFVLISLLETLATLIILVGVILVLVAVAMVVNKRRLSYLANNT